MMRKQLQDRRAGFTLIELLIVVVIIGILAAIALPRLAGTREGAYFSAVTSDLRNLANAMEVHYGRNGFTYDDSSGAQAQDAAGTYAWDANPVAPLGDLWWPSTGITVEVEATPQGWRATAVHTSIVDGAGTMKDPACLIYVGQDPGAQAIGGATPQEGSVGCDRT